MAAEIDPEGVAPPDFHAGADVMMAVQRQIIYAFLVAAGQGANPELWWRGFLTCVSSTIESQLGREATMDLLRRELELADTCLQNNHKKVH